MELEVSASAMALDGTIFTAAFVRDITRRKKVESEMRRNQGLLESAQSIAKMGSFELDISTNRLEWSKELYRIYEIDDNDRSLTFEKVLKVLHPDDRFATQKIIHGAISGETEPENQVYRITTPKGNSKILVFVHLHLLVK